MKDFKVDVASSSRTLRLDDLRWLVRQFPVQAAESSAFISSSGVEIDARRSFFLTCSTRELGKVE